MSIAGWVEQRLGGWLRRRTERRTIDSLPWDVGGVGTSALSVDQALRLAPVYAAGRLLASSVAGTPLQNYRKQGEFRQKIPLPALLRKPSVEGTLYDWLFRAMTSMIYRGNAVGLVTGRDGMGFPTGIEWLNPDWVHVQDQNISGPGSFLQPLWYYHGRLMVREDLVHIPWFVLPGRVWGLSPIAAYAATVNVGLAAQIYSQDWFKSGGAPMGVWKNTEVEIDADQAEIMKQRALVAQRKHEPVVHGKDWTYDVPVTLSQQDAAFVETMRLSATQIAAIYGIPPEMIGGETGSTSITYATTEQHSINFLQFALLPWLTKLESALFEILPAPQYVKFNADALIRVDSATRWSNHKIARDAGLMSVDEIRALEDMPPLPDGKGADAAPLGAGAGVPAPPPAVTPPATGAGGSVVRLSGRR